MIEKTFSYFRHYSPSKIIAFLCCLREKHFFVFFFLFFHARFEVLAREMRRSLIKLKNTKSIAMYLLLYTQPLHLCRAEEEKMSIWFSIVPFTSAELRLKFRNRFCRKDKTTMERSKAKPKTLLCVSCLHSLFFKV